MKRVQSAKTSPESRLSAMRTQHKRFSLFIESLSPSASVAAIRSKPAETDVLIQVRKFRHHGKQPSFSRSEQASIPEALKKGILVKETKPKRPNSSPSKHVSILQTARSIESLPPVDPMFAFTQQQDANDRLFRGSRVEISPRPETFTNPLFRFADIIDSSNALQVERSQVDADREKHRKFTASLKSLKSLAFELDLNYDMAVAPKGQGLGEESQLGAYYTLLEDIQAALDASLNSMLSESRSGFAARLTNYTKMVRSLLRGLKAQGLENECLMIEMIWKLTIKLFDSAMEIHDHTIDDAVEMTKYRVRAEIEKRRKEVDETTARWRGEEAKLMEVIRKHEANAAYLQGERMRLEHELGDRQEELAKLTDINVRENVVIEMQQLYKKMANYLSDAELEQTRQATVLEGIEVIMEAAKRLQQRPLARSISVQSDGERWQE